MRLLPLLLLLLCVPVFAEDDPPYPKGSTSQTLEELRCQLIVPNDWDAGKEYSLVVVLHGAGGEETSMAMTLQPLAKEDFIVLAPKSTDQVWSVSDLKKVKAIIEHLSEVLNVGEKRLHGMGFSNGGWNLDRLVFDDDLHFVSACWVAAGCSGGKVPRWAKRDMGAMALAGSEDGNRPHAEKTVDILKDKVRTVECHLQKGLGHKFPREYVPYYFYWVKVMDGRFEPGVDMSFDWQADVDAARQRMADRKQGGFLYFYTKDDGEGEETKRVQNEIFFDPLVRRFGKQLNAVKLELSAHRELFDSFRLKSTPAVVVLAPDFKLSKKYEGSRIKARSLAGALRKFAKDKTVPR